MRAIAVVEPGCLHRDEQEVDGLVELLHGLERARTARVVGDERQAVVGDRRGRLRPSDADDPLARERQATRERAADRPGPENGGRHAFAGSVMRFTYFHSE